MLPIRLSLVADAVDTNEQLYIGARGGGGAGPQFVVSIVLKLSHVSSKFACAIS